MNIDKRLVEELNNGIVPKEIKNCINEMDKENSRYKKLDNYYKNSEDVLNKTRILSESPNNIILSNYARYISVLNVGYFMGNELKYNCNIDITKLLDKYSDNTIIKVDQSNAMKISKYGKAYELVYVNEKGNIKSKSINPSNAIILKSDDLDEEELVGIYKASDKNIYIYTTEKCIQFNGKTVTDVKEHFFGKLPLIEYINNEDKLGDYETVITLIDAYNKIVSNDIDNIEEFVDSILIVKGPTLTPEQLDLLKETRGMSLNKEDSAEYLTKVLDEIGISEALKRLRQDIHKFSFTPDMSDENFIGNSSGVALAYKLLPFEMLANTKEGYYEESVKRRFELYNLHLNKVENMVIVPLNELDVVFSRKLPKNDVEVANMIATLQGMVTNKTLISNLSFIKDPNEEDELIKEEDNQKKSEISLMSANYNSLDEAHNHDHEEE